MSIAAAESPLAAHTVPEDLLTEISGHAAAVDSGEISARRFLQPLGAEGLLCLGASNNTGGQLLAQASVIERLAESSLSAAFAVWGHRMAVEYLTAADTPYARTILPSLVAGETPGVSGMASAFKHFAGAGDLDLTATREGDELVLNGVLPWASNLYSDAVVVSAAWETSQDGRSPVVLGFPLQTPGVELGPDLDLLALRGTASTLLRLTDVRVPTHQILSEDSPSFLSRCRPTFAVLQASFCLGLATASFRAAQSAIHGLNAVFAEELAAMGEDLIAAKATLRDYSRRVGTQDAPTRSEILSLRLEAGQLAVALARLENKTAGGKGYVVTSAANRRLREATFIPVQSPSEAQLRWELENGT